jgi:hypothetical protein
MVWPACARRAFSNIDSNAQPSNLNCEAPAGWPAISFLNLPRDFWRQCSPRHIAVRMGECFAQDDSRVVVLAARGSAHRKFVYFRPSKIIATRHIEVPRAKFRAQEKSPYFIARRRHFFSPI